MKEVYHCVGHRCRCMSIFKLVNHYAARHRCCQVANQIYQNIRD